ncbi:MAG: DUF4097 family beta strand repeat protein [Candidatus Riflebacteria bacterium]|nr:DUF4097 family beta strand repeat protein [Candidatus Riflebacteria bacterium]
MSEARKRILNMLAQGKISVEESEELLLAMETDEKAKNQAESGKKNVDTESTSGNSFRFPFGRAFGADLENLAEEVQKQVGKAVRGIQPQSQELKMKLKDLGGWLGSTVGKMVCEMQFSGSDLPDAIEVECMIPEPQGFAGCKFAEISNLQGSINIREAETFGLKIRGRISRAALGDQSASSWFSANAISIRGEKLFLGFERTSAIKAILDIDMFLPARIDLQIRTLAAPVTVYGPFRIASAESVSGDLKFTHALFENSSLETVSADVIIEGGALEMSVKMTSGDLKISGARVEKLTVQTVSGDVVLSDLALSDSTSLDVSTTSGDVSLRRPNGAIAHLEARSRTGQVQIRLPGTRQPLDKYGIIVEAGETGARIKTESISGDLLFD